MNAAATRAAVLMLLATIVFSSMHTLVRFVGQELHPFEIAFFRNLFGFFTVLPLIVRSRGSCFISAQPRLQMLRGVTGLVAMLGWFYGLSKVPVAAATALNFTAALFASLGAVVVLGERMGVRRWSALLLGFAGTLIVLRPGFGDFGPGAGYILVSSLCWGCSIVIVKQLSRTDSAITVVVWMSVSLTLLSAAPAWMVWQRPTAVELGWMALIAVLGTGGHLILVNALKRADASQLMPIDFTRLVWTSIFGYLAFGEVPEVWIWVGGSVIFVSAAYITYREQRLQRLETPAPAA